MKEETKKKILKRLRIAGGQIRGLEKLVEKETYCVDVITQIEAVRQALSGVKNVMLENHLSTHVVEQIKNNEKQKAVKEILKVYKLGQQ